MVVAQPREISSKVPRDRVVNKTGEQVEVCNKPEIIDEPREHAKSAGLSYVVDRSPGITRRADKDGFAYFLPGGEPLTDERDLARIKALAIPPAWTDVWICTSKRGHLQATGRDARGRKQYRYHAQWRATRDAVKFDRLTAFARGLPGLRARVAEDMRKQGLPREKVIATLVHLLENTLIRIGNDEYARENGSYGLTTLRNKHVEVNGSGLKFKFIGKGGKRHLIDVSSPRLARIVGRLRELPGQELFQYVDDDGQPRSVDSADVNEYLREAMSEEFSAKDVRTWQATVLTATHLATAGPASSETSGKREINAAIKATSETLGNTPAVCRKCYVHPAVIDAYMRGVTIDPSVHAGHDSAPGALSPEEQSTLALLEQG